jgi:hypothetical protein
LTTASEVLSQALSGGLSGPRQCATVSERISARKMDGKKEGNMNAIPELTDKQNEALDTLVDLFRRSRKNDPDAQTAFLGLALLLAQQSVLDYLVAAPLTQAQNLNIPPTQSLLFKDMAFEIEAVMREKK